VNSILSDVFDFFGQLRFVSYDVIEALIQPDPAPSHQNLVYPASRPSFDQLENVAHRFIAEKPEDRMHVIGHYHRGIKINVIFVASLDFGNQDIPRRRREHYIRPKRNEVVAPETSRCGRLRRLKDKDSESQGSMSRKPRARELGSGAI
jgi:hypothetical protein